MNRERQRKLEARERRFASLKSFSSGIEQTKKGRGRPPKGTTEHSSENNELLDSEQGGRTASVSKKGKE